MRNEDRNVNITLSCTSGAVRDASRQTLQGVWL